MTFSVCLSGKSLRLLNLYAASIFLNKDCLKLCRPLANPLRPVQLRFLQWIEKIQKVQKCTHSFIIFWQEILLRKSQFN